MQCIVLSILSYLCLITSGSRIVTTYATHRPVHVEFTLMKPAFVHAVMTGAYSMLVFTVESNLLAIAFYKDSLLITACFVDTDTFMYTVIVLVTTANWL